MTSRRKPSSQERERRWREQKMLTCWTCPKCHKENQSVWEHKDGKLFGKCVTCGVTRLVFMPSPNGYIDAIANDIMIADD